MTCGVCSSEAAGSRQPSISGFGDGMWTPCCQRSERWFWCFFVSFCPFLPTLTAARKSSWLIQRTCSPFPTCWDCVFAKVKALLKFACFYFSFIYLFQRKIQRLALSAPCELNRRRHRQEHRLIIANTLFCFIVCFFFPPSDCKYSAAAFHDRDLSTSANFNYY